MDKKSLYQRLADIKLEISQAKLKKSGMNKYSGFSYYELADILPTIISACQKHGVYTYTTYDNEMAKLVAINTDDGNERIEITSPMRTFELKGSNAIQVLGGIETYSRRYLYLAMFDIVESDTFDANCGSDKNIEIRREIPQKKEVVRKEVEIPMITEVQKRELISLGYRGSIPLDSLTLAQATKYIKMGYEKKGAKNENNI